MTRRGNTSRDRPPLTPKPSLPFPFLNIYALTTSTPSPPVSGSASTAGQSPLSAISPAASTPSSVASSGNQSSASAGAGPGGTRASTGRGGGRAILPSSSASKRTVSASSSTTTVSSGGTKRNKPILPKPIAPAPSIGINTPSLHKTPSGATIAISSANGAGAVTTSNLPSNVNQHGGAMEMPRWRSNGGKKGRFTVDSGGGTAVGQPPGDSTQVGNQIGSGGGGGGSIMSQLSMAAAALKKRTTPAFTSASGGGPSSQSGFSAGKEITKVKRQTSIKSNQNATTVRGSQSAVFARPQPGPSGGHSRQQSASSTGAMAAPHHGWNHMNANGTAPPTTSIDFAQAGSTSAPISRISTPSNADMSHVYNNMHQSSPTAQMSASPGQIPYFPQSYGLSGIVRSAFPPPDAANGNANGIQPLPINLGSASHSRRTSISSNRPYLHHPYSRSGSTTPLDTPASPWEMNGGFHGFPGMHQQQQSQQNSNNLSSSLASTPTHFSSSLANGTPTNRNGMALPSGGGMSGQQNFDWNALENYTQGLAPTTEESMTSGSGMQSSSHSIRNSDNSGSDMQAVNMAEFSTIFDTHSGGEGEQSGLTPFESGFDPDLFASLAGILASSEDHQGHQHSMANQQDASPQITNGSAPWGSQQQTGQQLAAPQPQFPVGSSSGGHQSLLSRRLQQYRSNSQGAENVSTSLPTQSYMPGSQFQGGMPATSSKENILPTPPASFSSTFAYPPGHLNRRMAGGWGPDRGVGRNAGNHGSNVHMPINTSRQTMQQPSGHDTPATTPAASDAGQANSPGLEVGPYEVDALEDQ